MSRNKRFISTEMFIGEFHVARNNKHLYMKQLSKLTLALLITATVLCTASCAASKKSHCGCEGMVGYK
jgi:hypothetical protein